MVEEIVEVLEVTVEILEEVVVETKHMTLQTHQSLNKTAQEASTVDFCSQRMVATLFTPNQRLTYQSKSTS